MRPLTKSRFGIRIAGCVLCLIVVATGCKQSEDSKYMSNLRRIELEYKQGSDKAWTFSDVDRNAPKAVQRTRTANDIEAESRRIAGLAARIRQLKTPIKYTKLRDADLELMDGDVRVETAWVQALRRGETQVTNRFAPQLAESELTASKKIIAAQDELGMDTRQGKKQLESAEATLQELKKQHPVVQK